MCAPLWGSVSVLVCSVACLLNFYPLEPVGKRLNFKPYCAISSLSPNVYVQYVYLLLCTVMHYRGIILHVYYPLTHSAIPVFTILQLIESR